MDQESKKIFTDSLQKNLTRTCYKKCRDDQDCFKICYDKYLKTVSIVNDTIKCIGNQKLSIIPYKAYPEHNIQYLYHLQKQFVGGVQLAPFAVQHESGS